MTEPTNEATRADETGELSEQNACRVQALFRLAMARESHPELHRAMASARIDLAAAIIAMDEAEDIPGRHNLHEQAAVNEALAAYGQALADLIRGEKS